MRESLIGLIPAIKKSFNSMRSNESAGYVFKSGLIIGIIILIFTAVIYLAIFLVMLAIYPQKTSILKPAASPILNTIRHTKIALSSSAYAVTDLAAPADPTASQKSVPSDQDQDDGIQEISDPPASTAPPADLPPAIPPADLPPEMPDYSNSPADPYDIFSPDAPAPTDNQWQPDIDPMRPDPVYPGAPPIDPAGWISQTDVPVNNIFTSAGGIILSLVFVLFIFLISFYNQLLVIKVSAGIGDLEYLRMGGLLKYPFKKLGSMFILSILMMLIYTLGFLLLIIPGFIFVTMFMFAPIILVKEDVGAIEALKRSKALTSGYRFNLFLKGVGFTLLMILSFIPIMIFMYATVMVGSFAFNVFFYEVLYTIYLDLKRIKSTEIELNTPPAVPAEPAAGSARTETSSLSGQLDDTFAPGPNPLPTEKLKSEAISLAG